MKSGHSKWDNLWEHTVNEIIYGNTHCFVTVSYGDFSGDAVSVEPKQVHSRNCNGVMKNSVIWKRSWFFSLKMWGLRGEIITNH